MDMKVYTAPYELRNYVKKQTGKVFVVLVLHDSGRREFLSWKFLNGTIIGNSLLFGETKSPYPEQHEFPYPISV